MVRVDALKILKGSLIATSFIQPNINRPAAERFNTCFMLAGFSVRVDDGSPQMNKQFSWMSLANIFFGHGLRATLRYANNLRPFKIETSETFYCYSTR